MIVPAKSVVIYKLFRETFPESSIRQIFNGINVLQQLQRCAWVCVVVIIIMSICLSLNAHLVAQYVPGCWRQQWRSVGADDIALMFCGTVVVVADVAVFVYARWWLMTSRCCVTWAFVRLGPKSICFDLLKICYGAYNNKLKQMEFELYRKTRCCNSLTFVWKYPKHFGPARNSQFWRHL